MQRCEAALRAYPPTQRSLPVRLLTKGGRVGGRETSSLLFPIAIERRESPACGRGYPFDT